MQNMEIILMCKAMMATLPTSKVPEIFILTFVVWLHLFAMYVYIITKIILKKRSQFCVFLPLIVPSDT